MFDLFFYAAYIIWDIYSVKKLHCDLLLLGYKSSPIFMLTNLCLSFFLMLARRNELLTLMQIMEFFMC